MAGGKIGKKFYMFMTPRTPLVTREDTANPLPAPLTPFFTGATSWPNCVVHFSSLSSVVMAWEGGGVCFSKNGGRKEDV
jgi:hypothetical protein